MVGKFEGEKSTKLITLLILRLPAKIQKYQIGPAEKNKTGVIRTTLTFLILGKTDILAFSDSFAIELSFVFWVYGLKQPLDASKWPFNFSLKP